MAEAARKAVMRPVAEIFPYEHNPRLNERAVDSVENSIKEFGFQVPIIVDAESVIICGHTRLMAAQRLGLSKVPVIVADDLTDDQVRAFRIADNRLGELAEWDEDKLTEEFLKLGGAIDLELFGFRAQDFRTEAELESEFSGGNAPGAKEKKAKTMKCPNCGLEFEV